METTRSMTSMTTRASTTTAATRTTSRCACGARKSRYATHCRRCDARRRDARLAEARAIVATGVCPDCGSKLRRNLALSGWWQCSQYGADTHRADPTRPDCGFQTFTE